MRWEPLIVVPLALVSSTAWGNVYLSTEQAQQAVFPGAKFVPVPIHLSKDQREMLRARSGVHEPFQEDRVWLAESKGFFIVDQVVGKHELITYAVGLNLDGSVRQVEILEYRETYGSEVRTKAWRQQFVGKTPSSPVKLNQDITNITGATLSSKHVTDGVRRVLAVYELALKGLTGAQR